MSYMSDDQRETLVEAYEFWKDHTIGKVVAGVLTDDVWENLGNGACIGGGSPKAGADMPRCRRHHAGPFYRQLQQGDKCRLWRGARVRRLLSLRR
jgi:hypothetical protein